MPRPALLGLFFRCRGFPIASPACRWVVRIMPASGAPTPIHLGSRRLRRLCDAHLDRLVTSTNSYGCRQFEYGVLRQEKVLVVSEDTRPLRKGDRVRLHACHLTPEGVIVDEYSEDYVSVQWDDLPSPTTYSRRSLALIDDSNLTSRAAP